MLAETTGATQSQSRVNRWRGPKKIGVGNPLKKTRPPVRQPVPVQIARAHLRHLRDIHVPRVRRGRTPRLASVLTCCHPGGLPLLTPTSRSKYSFSLGDGRVETGGPPDSLRRGAVSKCARSVLGQTENLPHRRKSLMCNLTMRNQRPALPMIGHFAGYAPNRQNH
jgi:hypothetical protein